MQENIERLEEMIGYRFKRKHLIEEALTHPSCDNGISYERLEFLGDLILDAIVGITLFKKNPSASESFLTDLKSAYVNRKYLQKIGEDIKLHKCIQYRGYEVPHLDNFIEGIIGAIYLDSGWKSAETFVKRFILNKKIEPMQNYKNLLSSIARKEFKTEPVYQVISEKGPPHKKIYTVKVKIHGKRYVGTGKAGNKKDAEMSAAEELLRKLGLK
ncbi:MAG: ribonuclease III [Candidatus Ratteibacteria bacterium]|nr:ribonuclease III [Candidatus Ratteibacteria bacterium]